jgi:hypothetical protein
LVGAFANPAFVCFRRTVQNTVAIYTHIFPSTDSTLVLDCRAVRLSRAVNAGVVAATDPTLVYLGTTKGYSFAVDAGVLSTAHATAVKFLRLACGGANVIAATARTVAVADPALVQLARPFADTAFIFLAGTIHDALAVDACVLTTTDTTTVIRGVAEWNALAVQAVVGSFAHAALVLLRRSIELSSTVNAQRLPSADTTDVVYSSTEWDTRTVKASIEASACFALVQFAGSERDASTVQACILTTTDSTLVVDLGGVGNAIAPCLATADSLRIVDLPALGHSIASQARHAIAAADVAPVQLHSSESEAVTVDASICAAADAAFVHLGFPVRLALTIKAQIQMWRFGAHSA